MTTTVLTSTTATATTTTVTTAVVGTRTSSGVHAYSIGAAATTATTRTVKDENAISAEIEAITEQIRRAIKCPVCLLLVPNMSCYCPNGHAMCDECLDRMWDLNAVHKCPMCRSPWTMDENVSATAMKLTEAVALVKVACAHRPYGCAELVTVSEANQHEAVCAHVPSVQCFMYTCRWVGTYEQLFDHMFRAHPKNSVDSTTSHRLCLENASQIKYNRRRTYLVRTMYGMLWILLYRETRGRIRIGVFMVEKLLPVTSGPPPDPSTTNMTYQIRWSDSEGPIRTASKYRRVAWSSALKGYKESGIAALGNLDPFTVIRSRSGRLEICWSYSASSRRNPNNNNNNNNNSSSRSSTSTGLSVADETVVRPDDQRRF